MLQHAQGWAFLGGSRITADGDCSHEIKRRFLLGRKAMTNLDSILKSRDITLLTNVCLVKAMVFSSSHVWVWELDHKGSWVGKNWCFWTVVLEKTLENPLDCKEIQPVHPKGDQPWVFIGRIDVEAETPILWPPDAKNWLIRKVYKGIISIVLIPQNNVAAAAAKSLQLCPTLCDPIDGSAPGSPVPGILKATLEWVAISFSRESS